MIGRRSSRNNGGLATRPLAVTAPARVGRRTKDLVKVLRAGEIAVIDHADIDRVAADALVRSRPAAVVNASPSITGRYPNGGPLRLLHAGVPLIDDVGSELLDRISDGDLVTVTEGRVLLDGQELAHGRQREIDDVERAMADARGAIGLELESFATNTLEYIQAEAKLLFEPLDLPPIQTDFRGRHALVVVRGHDYREDLNALRPYIREYRPVLVAVDGGADALLEVGLTPDLIIGDFDSVSETALGTARDLVHHVHLDGRAPGRENLHAWKVPYHEFVIDGTSEDAAMLLAYEAGASLIVAVGTHATMVEFLDKGRKGMSSTFLTRLRLGPMLVDAKGVNKLYEHRVRKTDLVWLVLAAVTAIVVMTVVSEAWHVFLEGFWLTLRDLWLSVSGAF